MASRESRRSVDFHGLQNLACQVFLEKVLSKTTPETVDFVRDFIDQQYAGLVKRAVREWCVKELYKMMSLHQQPPSVNIFAVMDCILDVHFTSLKVCLPSPAFKSFSDLMAIITRQCPNLEELEVTFQNTETFNGDELYTIPPGSQLPYLKSLIFYCLPANDANETSESQDSILSIVGKLCPVLTKLEVYGPITKTDIVALIVNAEMAKILFKNEGEKYPWFQDSVHLSSLRIPTQFLNPLCSTLKELILRWRYDVFFTPVMTFALRHLPKLEDLHVDGVLTIRVVYILYLLKAVDYKSFEEAWREAASQLGLDVETPVTFFSGISSLKSIDDIPINDPCALRAVLEFCPSASKVKFVEEGTIEEEAVEEEVSSSSSQVGLSEEILKAWSNTIDSVELELKDPDFVKMVINIFGPKIKNLSLNVESYIDMDHLASNCTSLEKICFHGSSIIMDSEAASRWTPETFLPKLSHLSRTNPMDGCLGVWGLLIEKKSTMKHLSLHCCHIGTNAHNPRLEWSQLPQLWPQLEFLSIEHCTGLTMTTLADIIPQFPKLRSIDLPSSLRSQDPRALLKRKMMEEKPIEIQFSKPFGNSLCLF